MVETIEREELRGKLQTGAIVLIDTLPRTAYARGHIPGAISIPSEEVAERAPERLPDAEAEIVVYCKNGPCRRSEKAAARLAALGYRRVHNYHGGREDWTAAGLPLRTGAET